MQEIISWITQNWLTITVAAFLIAIMLIGHSKGFLRLGLSTLNLLLALIGAKLLLPVFIGLVRQQPTVQDYAVAYIVLFLVVWIVLRIFIRIADLFSKIPIIHGLNQIAGALLGVLYGLIILWVICIVIEAFGELSWAKKALEMISGSRLLSYIYEHNLLKKYLVS